MKRAGSSPCATSSLVRQSCSSAAARAGGAGERGRGRVGCQARTRSPQATQAASPPACSPLGRAVGRSGCATTTQPAPPAHPPTNLVQVEALGVVAGQAPQEGGAVLGGAEAGLDGAAAPDRAVQRADAAQRVCGAGGAGAGGRWGWGSPDQLPPRSRKAGPSSGSPPAAGTLKSAAQRTLGPLVGDVGGARGAVPPAAVVLPRRPVDADLDGAPKLGEQRVGQRQRGAMSVLCATAGLSFQRKQRRQQQQQQQCPIIPAAPAKPAPCCPQGLPAPRACLPPAHLAKVVRVSQRLLVADLQGQAHRVHQCGLHHADVLLACGRAGGGGRGGGRASGFGQQHARSTAPPRRGNAGGGTRAGLRLGPAAGSAAPGAPPQPAATRHARAGWRVRAGMRCPCPAGPSP